MTTIINPNTFKGPNQGNVQGYIPQTIIESAKIDADMLQILADLDKLLSAVQIIALKLDQIDLNTIGPMTAAEIAATINSSSEKFDSDNLADDVVTDTDLNTAIESHRATTTFNKMHPETSIRSTELTYSSTPTTLVTSCSNILDELKNIRYQINRLNGKTNWSDTPVASLSSLYTALNTDIANLTSHIANTTLHLTPCQNQAADNANNPCACNPFATMNDIATHGNGDMLRSVYDKDKDGIVDSAEALKCSCGNKTYDDIVSKIATDIDTHKTNASAHHTRYTNAEAIGAINNDSDHSSTAKHYYKDLLGKPTCDRLTEAEVTNIQASKLADGTSPWVNVVMKSVSGLVPIDTLPIEHITTTWTENVVNTLTNTYFSSTLSGGVTGTITGPCYIYSGFGVVSENNGYLQYSVDGGTTWNDCITSQSILRGPAANGDNLRVWILSQLDIPNGLTYKIRAGSTYTGSSDIQYGASYNIRYKAY